MSLITFVAPRAMRRLFVAASAVLLAACLNNNQKIQPTPQRAGSQASSTAPTPPIAARRAYAIRSANGVRSDDYYWLRDDTRSNPEVLDYLKAENAYTDAVLAHTKAEQDLLFKEIVGRIKQDDATVPVFENGYWYYTRFEEGREYPINARKKGTLDASEQVLLDGNAMAAGHDFFQIADSDVTLDNKTLAYTEDTVGRRQWVLHFKDIETGTEYPEIIANVDGQITWAADNQTVLYVEKDPVTLLGDKVRKHRLGSDPKNDPLVYQEKDHSFYMGVARSASNKLVWIALHSTVSTEEWVADAADPKLNFHVLIPRERDHEYQAIDFGDKFIVRTNWKAKNFRIIEVPAAKVADRSTWKDVIANRDDAFVDDFFVFNAALAVNERSKGLLNIRLHRWSDGKDSLIAAEEPTYSMSLGDNREPNAAKLRYNYTSLTTPKTVYDFDFASSSKTLMKRDPVLGDFDPSHYQSEFVWVPARDGAQVPVSLVYRKGFQRDGSAALLQLGYGSYGLSTDPTFSTTLLSLLDRGFVVAIAHVRGGEEMGRDWYDDGHMLQKKNTFNDFVDVTRWLAANRYAAKDRIFARGGSAGGLLMGAIVNQCPECYRGVLAHVPFVDVVTTMLDESIPLTTNEFDEWGNPKDKISYDYMLSYSPYDNVQHKAYPALLVSTGLWDSQVQYYEPAKWVAKLRAYKTDSHPLLFHVNMQAGHGGKSGRFQAYHETALYWAFLFDQLGRDVAQEAGAGGAAQSTSQKADEN